MMVVWRWRRGGGGAERPEGWEGDEWNYQCLELSLCFLKTESDSVSHFSKGGFLFLAFRKIDFCLSFFRKIGNSFLFSDRFYSILR